MTDTEHEPDENPDAEPAEPIEPDEDEPEQTPEEAAAAEGSADVARKLERENDRHFKAVSKILDTNMEELICPTCDGFGFADESQRNAAASALPSDFVHPDNYVTCEACNGYGQILSGSKNRDFAIVTCTGCSGQGYKIVSAQISALPPPPPYAPPADQPIGGQYVPGRGFIPYGATEPMPGTA